MKLSELGLDIFLDGFNGCYSVSSYVAKKNLSVRIHHCPNCGLTLDRDVNAARNILFRGIGLEQPESTLVGEETNTQLSVVGRVASMNQEATRLVGW